LCVSYALFSVEKANSFANEQGRSSIPLEERIEDWEKLRIMIPQSSEWESAKIQPECRELIQKRFSLSPDMGRHPTPSSNIHSLSPHHIDEKSKTTTQADVTPSSPPQTNPTLTEDLLSLLSRIYKAI